MQWKYLTDANQLNDLIQDSQLRPQIIFKHSTRCIISKMVLGEFENSFNQSANNADLYFLDLLQFREISNQIAIQFNVRHESPQVLLLRNGIVAKNESHDSIKAPLIENWIAENN